MSLLHVADLLAVAERDAMHDPPVLEQIRSERARLVRQLEREAGRKVSPWPPRNGRSFSV